MGKRKSERARLLLPYLSYSPNVTHFTIKVRYVSVCALISCLPWQRFALLPLQGGEKLFDGAFCVSFPLSCAFIFPALTDVSHVFARLIGRDSREQNADSTGNEAIMVRLFV